MDRHKKARLNDKVGQGIGYRLGLHIIIPALYFGSLAAAFIIKYL